MHEPAPTAQTNRPRVWSRRVLRWGVGLVGLVAAMVSVDVWHGSSRTARGLTAGGQDLGRLTQSELQRKVQSIEDRYIGASIPVRVGDRVVEAKGIDLGLKVDRPRLVADAFAIGRTGPIGSRIKSYVHGWFGGTSIEVPVSASPSHLRRWLRKADRSFTGRPGHPVLIATNSRWAIHRGKPGRAVDPNAAASIIGRALRKGPSPAAAIGLKRVNQPSSYSDAELAGYEKVANAATRESLEIVVGERTVSLSATDLRSLTKASVVDDTVSVSFEGARTMQTIKARLGDAVSTSPVDARFEVQSIEPTTESATESATESRGESTTEPTAGSTSRPATESPSSPTPGQVEAGEKRLVVTVLPSVNGTTCCGTNSVERLNSALAAPVRHPVVLDTNQIPASVTTESLQSLSIVEPIGTFTTKHKAGEVRVKNIHRIADLLQGKVIKPGETFSVNDTIGPRSKANGFFSAGVIEQGLFKEDFGGGISQFATTMFNAAFFAGLDLVEYQAHSLYINRYPYGREATLSFPKPDLKVRNNTPHGILIWPTYTSTTITVTLFSTSFVKGEAVGQTKRSSQFCTQVITNRKRTYADGRTDFDSVRALYRPAEGKDCNGQLTPAARAAEREKQTRKLAKENARLARAKARAQARAQRQPSAQPNPPVAVVEEAPSQ